MAKRAGPHPHSAGSGFTLIELLLTVVLLLVLAGAAVISFSSLLHSSELDEGVNQLEALARFARAQAANTGKKVQLTFQEMGAEGVLMPMGTVGAVWEPDPVDKPGEFVPLPEAQLMVRSVNELLWFEEVRHADDPGATVETEDDAGTHEVSYGFEPITFYPDGSNDSAEIIISAVSFEERRKVSFKISGITGAIRRAWIAPEEVGAETVEEPAP
jgi:prepilin-type N-terminal cleavage/methylation domain-containing protein